MIRKWLSDFQRVLRASHRHSERQRFTGRKLCFDRLEMRALLAASVIGDFNGDGVDDMAIGVGEGIGGGVNVIYGTPAGLSSNGNQLWTQDSPGILDVAEAGDGFGNSLAVGDFDNDGFDDLAVGASGEEVNGFVDSGAVTGIYG